jgi:hypothetical protein
MAVELKAHGLFLPLFGISLAIPHRRILASAAIVGVASEPRLP